MYTAILPAQLNNLFEKQIDFPEGDSYLRIIHTNNCI